MKICTIKNVILFLTIILCTVKGVSQEEKKLPISIYSFEEQISFLKNESSINNNLNLKGFNFMLLNIDDIKKNHFSFTFNNMFKTPTKYIYDSYKSIIFNETAKYFDPNRFPFLPKDNF